MGQAIGQVLPLAVAAAISPFPIIAIVLMLASRRARINGPSFLLGWILGLAVLGTIVLLISSGASAATKSGPAVWVCVLRILLGCVCLWLAAKQWRGRPKGEADDHGLPSWMEATEHFTAIKALGMGVMLAAVNPKNLLITIGAATTIAQAGISAGDEIIAFTVFAAVATLGVAIPLGIYWSMGDRATTILGDLKSWMAANNAVIMTVVMLVIASKLIGDGISGLST